MEKPYARKQWLQDVFFKALSKASLIELSSTISQVRFSDANLAAFKFSFKKSPFSLDLIVPTTLGPFSFDCLSRTWVIGPEAHETKNSNWRRHLMRYICPWFMN